MVSSFTLYIMMVISVIIIIMIIIVIIVANISVYNTYMGALAPSSERLYISAYSLKCMS